MCYASFIEHTLKIFKIVFILILDFNLNAWTSFIPTHLGMQGAVISHDQIYTLQKRYWGWCQWKGSRKERSTSRVCVTVIVSLGNCLDVRMILIEQGLMNVQHCLENTVLNQLLLLKLKGASKAQFLNPETPHGCAGQLTWLLSASYWIQNVNQHLLKLNTLYVSQEFWPRNSISRTKLMHWKNTSNPNSMWRNPICSPPMINWM
jgi:hypothetical protein